MLWLNEHEKRRDNLFVNFMCVNRSSTVHLHSTSNIEESAWQATC